MGPTVEHFIVIYCKSTMCIITQYLLNARHFLGTEQRQKMEPDPGQKVVCYTAWE